MARHPWTDPDPQPGDFDADPTAIDPHYVEAHVAERRHQRPAEAVADLLRSG